MKKLVFLFIFSVTGLGMAQTTITLEDQCNCEVLSGTAVTTAGMTTPTGADIGDIYVNTNTGTIYYWDGGSWELTSSDSQQLRPFTFDNTTGELVLTLENGGTSNVFLPLQTLTVLTLNGNSLEYEDENGLTNTIPLNVGNLSLGADGNSLDFTNEEGVTTNIPLNVGALSFAPATGELTYINELGAASVIILPAETITTISGASATGNAVGVYENENGDLVTINETITSISDIGDGNVTFINEVGASVTVSKSDITDLGGGIYRFTNNDGTDVDINTNGVTISDVIAGNLIATVAQADGSSVEIDETVTNITGTSITGIEIGVYEKEDGTTVSIQETITDITGTSTTGNEIGVYEKEDGTTVSLQETVTTISDLGDGNVTFTNESSGTTTVAKSDITANPDGTFTFDNGDGTTVSFVGTDNQNAAQVLLSPNLDVDGDSVDETTVQDAITNLAANSSDNQNLTGATLNGTNQLEIDIQRGSSTSVDLSSLVETVVAGTGAISVTDDGDGNYTVTSTDPDEDETNELTLVGSGVPTVTPTNSGVTYVDAAAGQLYVYDGAAWQQVGGSASPDLDPSPNNEIQDLDLTSDNLTLSLDPTATPIDLSVYRDNTDSQDLSISGNVLSLTGDGTTVTLPTADGSETVVNGGGINVVTGSGTAGSPYVVTGTEIDGSTTNEIQDLSISGNVLSLTGDGTTVTLPTADGSETEVNSGTDINVTGSGTTGDPYIVNRTFAEVDGSTTNEIQDLSISGNVLSLTGDGTTVTLPTADGTETGVTAGWNVTVTGDGSIATPYVVGVASLDDADADPNNEIQDLSISGNVLSLTGDGTTVTLPTADGSETVLNNGTNTVVNGSGTTASPYTIDVPDNTDDQDLSLTGDVLSLTGDGTTVNLSGYTNTDNQDLSISGNVLSLTGDGTTVTLPTVDGSETVLNNGTNTVVNGSGDGSSATPYVCLLYTSPSPRD